MNSGDNEDSMSFLIDMISGPPAGQQDEPMGDAAASSVQQLQQSTALDDIEPSYALFQLPPDVTENANVVHSFAGSSTVSNDAGNNVNSTSILWQQLTMPQQQEPTTAGAGYSAFQQYRGHSSCSSYSNFSSSVPSVASTPSLLSGFNTPAHPREWSRNSGGAYGSASNAAIAASSASAAAAATAADPEERRRRYADLNSLSRQELFDTLNSRLLRASSFGDDGASQSAGSTSDTAESPRWKLHHQHHRHHHSGGSGVASVSDSSGASAAVGASVDAAGAAEVPAEVDASVFSQQFKDEPATPPSTPSKLPRHQREPHKKAEKKRVEKIRQRLDQLRELCSGGSGADRSEAKLLSRVLTCMRELQLANKRAADEASALQTRLSKLEAEQKALLEALDDGSDFLFKVNAEDDAAIEDISVKFELMDDTGTPRDDAEMTSESTITHDCRQGLRLEVAQLQLRHQLHHQQQRQSQSHNNLSANLEAYSRERLASGEPGAVLFHRLIGAILVSSFRDSMNLIVADGANFANVNNGSLVEGEETEFRVRLRAWLSTLTIGRLRRDLNQRLIEVAADFV